MASSPGNSPEGLKMSQSDTAVNPTPPAPKLGSGQAGRRGGQQAHTMPKGGNKPSGGQEHALPKPAPKWTQGQLETQPKHGD